VKKSIRINISGYIFNIDEDAYDELNVWLKSVAAQFKNDENASEITSDIEARVAEIFNERISESKHAVNIDDISELISVMGTPEDFSDGEFIEENEDEPKGENSFEPTEKKKKKLFRDADERLLGGVCAGLGNYFGINANIVRAAFVITLLLWGTGTLVYILLWVLLDEAVTTADKLRMKGEKINISNIEKSISDEFSAVKSSLSARGSKFDYDKFHGNMSNLGESLWSVFQAVLKVTLFLIGIGLFLYGIIVFFSISAVFFFSDLIPGFVTNSSINFAPIRMILDVLPLGLSTTITAVSAYLVAIIPFTFIAVAGARVAFKFKKKFKYVGLAGITVWIVAVVITAFSAVGIAQNYSTAENFTEKVAIDSLVADTLHLKVNDSRYVSENSHRDLNFNNVFLSKKGDEVFLSGRPELNVKMSPDSLVYIETKYKASGPNKRKASENVRNLKYQWTQNESVFTFNNHFSIGKNTKYQNQSADIIVWLPIGKTVFLSDGMGEIIYDIKNVQDTWDPEMIGMYWTMTEEGLSSKPTKVSE